jgi:phospholipid/cholesterol/gamma-HCH transport system permease protein
LAFGHFHLGLLTREQLPMMSLNQLITLSIGALRAVGERVIDVTVGFGRVMSFLIVASGNGLREPGGVRAAVAQAIIITSRCALPVALVVGPIGAMMALQSLTLMRTFGVERQMAPLAAAIVIRELAPGFASVVVAMQGGAAIAAELAAMRLAEELDALDVMGLEPRGLIAGPRILGAAVAGPLLNALAITCGITGSYLMAVVVLGVPHTQFVTSLPEGITTSDLWLSELKTVVFGLGLGAICASAGFHCQRSTDGIGSAANRAVVTSVVFVLVANYLLNTALFGLRGGV